MFQLAQQKQRSVDVVRPRLVDSARAFAVGKQTLVQHDKARDIGAPDYYTRAVESAIREIDAIRSTALPTYVEARKRDLAPLQKQIELARAAMQVRHMILCANAHVFALEKAEGHKDPMVAWLRAKLDVLVARASKLGVYDGALDMKPRPFIEAKPMQKSATKKASNKTAHKVVITESSLAPTAHPQVTSSPRTRLARGTGPVATPSKAAPSSGAPTDPRGNTSPRVRPGFRPSAAL